MTLIIDKSNLKNTAKILNEKLKKSGKKGNLMKHFGKLKRNIDGLTYQISIRENEDWYLPLVTADKGFSKISELDLILIQI